MDGEGLKGNEGRVFGKRLHDHIRDICLFENNIPAFT